MPLVLKKNMTVILPDVWGVAVIVRELQEVIWAALLIRVGALNFWLQHVLSDLVPAVHAPQVLLAATLLCWTQEDNVCVLYLSY